MRGGIIETKRGRGREERRELVCELCFCIAHLQHEGLTLVYNHLSQNSVCKGAKYHPHKIL